MNGHFNTMIRKYNDQLNDKVQNEEINFERYTFLMRKLQEWIDVYDAKSSQL